MQAFIATLHPSRNKLDALQNGNSTRLDYIIVQSLQNVQAHQLGSLLIERGLCGRHNDVFLSFHVINACQKHA